MKLPRPYIAPPLEAYCCCCWGGPDGGTYSEDTGEGRKYGTQGTVRSSARIRRGNVSAEWSVIQEEETLRFSAAKVRARAGGCTVEFRLAIACDFLK